MICKRTHLMMERVFSAMTVDQAITAISKTTVSARVAVLCANGSLAATGAKVAHAYGQNPSQILDTHSPAKSNHPIFIYTHGGSWYEGSKNNQVYNKKEGLVGSYDYVLVSVEYRSGYETNWQGQADDISDAIAWVYQNAFSIGGDNRNIFVLWHSSGAHMTALFSMDDSFGVSEKLN